MSLKVDILKDFGSFQLDIAFEAEDETLGFLGASGCGKSLTLRSIAGIETPDEGTIIVNGTVFFDKAAGKKARINLKPQERKTALLFQNYQLFPNLTVRQNVAAGLNPQLDNAKQNALIHEQLSRFGLEKFENRYPLQLSGGQQQRVALARMLAAQPGILMLDEPFSALDAHLKSGLEQDLLGLFEHYKGSILYVSHDIDEAFRFCDRIAVVSDGHIEEMGEKDRILYEPQTLATLRLSGCKNTTPAQYLDDHHAFLPEWGITVTSRKPISQDVAYCGMRAKFIKRVQNPECNTYSVRVEHVSDSRFERTVLASFLPEPKDSTNIKHSSKYSIDEKNISPIQWHINKLSETHPLPEIGDTCLVHLVSDGLYFVNR